MKVAIVVLSDTTTPEGLGRVVNALVAAREFKDASDDVRMIFDGAGVKWPVELARENHKYHELYTAVADNVTGICEYCAGAFADQIRVARLPLAGEHDGHPSFRRLVQDGFQIITF